MCGLVALLALDGSTPDSTVLQRMSDSIRHRGPDDSGLVVEGPVGLAFRRLSILDLSPLGHQPMTAQDAPVSLIFNGEIYNYLELRQELRALGHAFRSSGDTEVLLRSYLQWGPECVGRLNGMWSFVIHDRRSGAVFGSRDRFGIKPLFRCQARSAIAFASEIKSILASGLVDPSANEVTVADFLVSGHLDQSNQTFFQGIQTVPAGHCFEAYPDGRYREWRYWSIESSSDAPLHPDGAFAALFEDAVRLHMRSDVPVAIHLSGGLDSTAIACAAARVRTEAGANGAIAAFCYQDPQYDESPYIDATLAQTGATKITLTRTPAQLWESLPEVLRAHDEPFHSFVAVVSYELMRLTARHGVKVVLNGHGADETLAGYGSYFANGWHSHFQSGHWGRLWQDLQSWSASNHRTTASMFLNVLGRYLRAALQSLSAYRQAGIASWQRNLDAVDWVRPELRALATPPRYPRPDLNSTLGWSVTHDPLPLYLRIEDRNSSAHSVEGRVPFLDHRLVNFAFSLAVEWRMRGRLNKYVLRESMRGRIPERVRTRADKMGFPVGLEQWLQGELYEPARALLTDESFRRTDGIDSDRLIVMLEEHRRGVADHGIRLFRAIQLFHWREMLRSSRGTRPAEMSSRPHVR